MNDYFDGFDEKFEPKNFNAYELFKSDMDYINDLMNIIVERNIVEKKPYFAHKELNNIEAEIGKIINHPYFLNAQDQIEILLELVPIKLNAAKLKNRAYFKLEWEI